MWTNLLLLVAMLLVGGVLGVLLGLMAYLDARYWNEQWRRAHGEPTEKTRDRL